MILNASWSITGFVFCFLPFDQFLLLKHNVKALSQLQGVHHWAKAQFFNKNLAKNLSVDLVIHFSLFSMIWKLCHLLLIEQQKNHFTPTMDVNVWSDFAFSCDFCCIPKIFYLGETELAHSMSHVLFFLSFDYKICSHTIAFKVSFANF